MPRTRQITTHEKFEYDKAGNRVKQTRGTETITYQYNGNDQLTNETSSATGPTVYQYDANGSLTSKSNANGTITYAYNLAKKLNGVTVGGTTTSYLYNDQGIRVRSKTGASATHYLVDANNHTGYAQVLEELASPGGAPTRSYVIGDDVLGQSTATTVSWLLYDGHGSTRHLVKSAADVIAQYNYEAYGQSLTTLPTDPEASTSLLYCGEQFDSTLNMYNLRARFYNPSNGRFNARDTFSGNNDDPQSLHKYAYANCDPVNGNDPSGKLTLVEKLVVTAVITILAGFLLKEIIGVSVMTYRNSDQSGTRRWKRGIDDWYSTYDTKIWIEPDDVNGLQKGKRCKPEEVIGLYKDWINQQSHLVPPELLASVLLAEMRHYNIVDKVFDDTNGGKDHSVGIAQIEAEDISAHGYLGSDVTVDQIRNRLRKPKEAIALLAQDIDYYAKQNRSFQKRGGLIAVWAASPEDEREIIVGGMTSAKDQDKYGATTQFGELGMEAYQDIRKSKLLEP